MQSLGKPETIQNTPRMTRDYTKLNLAELLMLHRYGDNDLAERARLEIYQRMGETPTPPFNKENQDA